MSYLHDPNDNAAASLPFALFFLADFHDALSAFCCVINSPACHMERLFRECRPVDTSDRTAEFIFLSLFIDILKAQTESFYHDLMSLCRFCKVGGRSLQSWVCLRGSWMCEWVVFCGGWVGLVNVCHLL